MFYIGCGDNVSLFTSVAIMLLDAIRKIMPKLHHETRCYIKPMELCSSVAEYMVRNTKERVAEMHISKENQIR